MGMSFGGAGGSTESQAKSSGTTANTYGPGQTQVQTDLGNTLSSKLTAQKKGVMEPGVVAQKNAAADTINKTSTGTLGRVNDFLASRGFGKSGTTGKAALQTDLARQSDLAGNEANFAGVQQALYGQNLLAALNYAFSSLGQSGSGVTTGTSSGWSLGGGVSAGMTPGKGWGAIT